MACRGHLRFSGCLLGFGLVLLGAPVRAHGGLPCPPAAEVSGDMDLVDAMRAELDRRGIADGAKSPAACPPVHAYVSQGDHTLKVLIDDPQGRSSEREVGSLAAAAALIESWARTDVPDPLLSRKATSKKPSPPPLVPSAEPLAPSSFSLGLAVDVAISNDGANWGGAVFSGCATYGPLCALFTARWSVSSVPSLHPEHRTELDALIGVRVPFTWGIFTVGPSLSAGMGWLRASRDAFELSRECDPQTDVCVGTDIAAATANATSLRTEAAVLLSLSPAEHVGVDFTLGFSWAPLSRNHLPPDDAATLPEPIIPLAGEPRWALRSALGVHWSGP